MKPLFEMPKRAGRESDARIAQKANSRTKKSSTVIKGGGTLLGRINEIKALVERNLGQYRDDYIVINTEEDLKQYFYKCVENNVISIDTETTGLDPIVDKIVGLCIYTPNQPAAYVPINHVSYITGLRADKQLDEKTVAKCLEECLYSELDIIMFNAKFDIRVIRNQLGVKDIYCTWDCFLAAKLLNENEPTHKLKALHKKYCLEGEQDAFSFDALFKGVSFDKIPINVGYLYAAHDAIITYELFLYQRKFLTIDNEREDLSQVAWVFNNIEMPCVKAVCDMEDNGIAFDFEYQKELSERYNQLLEDKTLQFYECCDKYSKAINAYRAIHRDDCKLSDPINMGSPTQLAILLYDIMKITPPDNRKPRGTGVDILQQIDNPIAKAVLEYRETAKLVNTYIDKLPECVNPDDGRIHCSFNQYGAKTGRMSSSEPNLQNIPSRNHDIRKMFVASPGYVLMSSDFSQQEPKCLAAMCKKQGDEQMYNTFMDGKDLYSEIASKAFNKTYEECREFNEDGTTNKEGKARRTQAKSVLLGVLYGRGEASIGEQLKVSTQKAHDIKESVFRGFPAIKKFEQSSLDMAYNEGYVTTVCGRKRRLPDLQLDEYEFKWKDGAPPDDDLLDFDSDNVNSDIPDAVINKYLRKLRNAWGSGKRAIFEEANAEGIWIVDNGAKIADAERQCVNARIQGSAADLTKLAMIDLVDNEELKRLGFRILVPVHDEIIAECPEENVKECSKLLAETMSNAAEKILEMPIKCDVEITRAWYGEEMVI